MKSTFKVLSLLVAITCLVWLTVLWHWQATDRDMSASDIVMYLGALPLMLFVMVLGARWALTGVDDRSLKRQERADAKAANKQGKAGAATGSAGVIERQAVMKVLVAHINCAAGSTANDLHAALRDQRPKLDAELRDDDGLPVLAARIASVDLLQVAPPLSMAVGLARQRDAAWAARDPSPELGRALAALAPCLAATIDSLRPWQHHFGMKDHEPPAHSDAAAADAALANANANANAAMQARVLVYAAWPAAADSFDRAVAELWLHHALDEARQGFIAPGRIVRPPCEPITSGPALLRHADESFARLRELRAAEDARAQQAAARRPRTAPQTAGLQATLPDERAPSDLVLLLACESHIGESTVAQWQREGLLCSSRQPKGRVPGEAAAAIVLAPDDWPDLDEPHAIAHRPALLERDKSIDAQGRTDMKVALQCAQQALAAANLTPDAIHRLLSDADQATPRGLETYASAQNLLPELDASTDLSLTGVACGHVGAPSTLMLLALAAHHANHDAQSCLALSVGHPQSRAAWVVRPAATH